MHDFWSKLGQNHPFGPKDEFFGKFPLNHFYLLMVPYHTAKFEKKKNTYKGFSDIGLHNSGPQSGQNCPFGPKEDLMGNFS